MRLLFSWFKKILDPQKTPNQSAVFSVSKDNKEFPNMIVAEVVKYSKHPNADRLRIVDLNIGSSVISPIVCGASNFEIGDFVILALPGAEIPHNQHDLEGKPFILTKAVIRGIESQGMICSGKELGLSDDSNGIMILNNSKQYLGQTFNSNMN